MKLKRKQVECYAGGRADERPRRIIIDGREYTVAKLLGSSVEESLESKQRRYRYTVLTDDGIALDILKASDGLWYTR